MNEKISSRYDVVVIGAGISGMTAAALLARAGMHVCVTEMRAQAGGCTCGFDRMGYHFETAVHWLNQCGPSGFVRRIFNYIAPDSPPAAINHRIRRYMGDAHDCLLTNDPDAMGDCLIAAFPNDKKGIRKFIAAARNTGHSFTVLQDMCRSTDTMGVLERMRFISGAIFSGAQLLRYLPFSAEHGLDLLLGCAGLKKVFCTEDRLLSCLVPIGWAANDDYQLPPVGGSRGFTQWLCPVLDTCSSRIAFNCRVVSILEENGKTIGVRVVHEGERRDIRAKYVLAACDAGTVYGSMLARTPAIEKIIRKQNHAEIFNSCVTVSIGLDRSPGIFGLGEEQVLLTRDDISRGEQSCGNPHKTEITVIADSVRDPTLSPAGRGTMTIYVPASIRYGNYWRAEADAGSGLVRGSAYRDFKREYADILIKRVEKKLCPGLSRHIEICEIATPLTYLRHTGNRDGAIMGFRPTFANIRRSVAGYSTPVRNLYIGSQWAELGGGVLNAVKTGMNSALLVMKQENPGAFRELCEVADGKVMAGMME